MSEERTIFTTPAWTLEVDTPETIAEKLILDNAPPGLVGYFESLESALVLVIRAAYEQAAVVCDLHAADRQKKMSEAHSKPEHDYFHDMYAAYQYAAEDIRKLKGGG